MNVSEAWHRFQVREEARRAERERPAGECRDFVLRLCERVYAAHCVLANLAEKRTRSVVLTEAVNLERGMQ